MDNVYDFFYSLPLLVLFFFALPESQEVIVGNCLREDHEERIMIQKKKINRKLGYKL